MRPTRARICGGFRYAPYESALERGLAATETRDQVADWPPDALVLSARIAEEARATRAPETAHAHAVVYLLRGRAADARALLEAVRAGRPADATVLTDLAAAWIAGEAASGDPLASARALAAADAALALQPALPEALFNRALALERLGLAPAAASARADYLAVDPSSQWADELRGASAEAARKSGVAIERLTAALAEAAARRDADAASRVVASAPGLAQAYASDELFGAWADAVAEGDRARAADVFWAIERVGIEVSRMQGDDFVRAGAEALESSAGSAERRAVLSQAHAAFRDGLARYAASEIRPARDLFARSRRLFARGACPQFAAYATYCLARCDFFAFRYEPARRRAEAARRFAQRRGYRRLLGRATLTLGSVANARFAFDEAIRLKLEALEAFERAGDLESVGLANHYLAQSYEEAGDPERALGFHSAALEATRGLDDGRRLLVLLVATAGSFTSAGAYDAALAYLDEAAGLLERFPDALVGADVAMRRGILAGRLGRSGDARADFDASERACAEIGDGDAARRVETAIVVARAAFDPDADAAKRIADLTAIARVYESSADRSYASEIYRLRGRAYRDLGDLDRAEADFGRALDALERERGAIGDEEVREAYLEGPQAAYDETIAFQLFERGRTGAALDVAERARARVLLDRVSEAGAARAPLGSDEIRARLPQDATVVVEYASLPSALVAWVVRRQSVEVVTSPVAEADLRALVDALRDVVDEGAAPEDVLRAATPLYDAVVAPIRPLVAPGERIVFVPDKALARVPFAALGRADGGRFLIEDFEIGVAPSANVFVRCLEREAAMPLPGRPSAYVVGNPRFDRDAFPSLPDLAGAEEEAREIEPLYPLSRLVTGALATKHGFLEEAGAFDVVHFAGHALVDLASPERSRLLLAKSPLDPEHGAVTAGELARCRLTRTRLVVLAACRGADGRDTPGEGPATLARVVLGLGVPQVVASLFDVDDSKSEPLLTDFHRSFAAGSTAPAALRAAQLSMLRSGDPRASAPKVWAGFEVFGGAPRRPGAPSKE